VKQPPKADTPHSKWVVQADTLRKQQQTTEICATLKFEAKCYEGDHTTVSPEVFEKLNIHTSSLQNGGEV